MRHLGLVLSIHLVTVLAPPLFAADGSPVVSVGIFSGRTFSACSITSAAAMEVVGAHSNGPVPSGAVVRLAADGSEMVVSAESQERATQLTITSAATLLITPEGLQPRTYRGALTVTVKEGRLALVNTLPLEDYLRGVVPAEMPAGFAPEALKAQAIAARTYSLVAVSKHRSSGYDLCDGSHCQVYLGASCEDPRIDAAIDETAGMIVTYQGKPIHAVYHDTCGWCTAGNDEAWSGDPVPYLRPVDDRWGGPPRCAASPRARWTRRIPQERLVGAFSSLGITGPLKLIAPEGCENGTRPKRYRIVSETGEWVVRASQMRELVNRALGWDTLLSADFVALLEEDMIDITGWGNGHGVGMCQWGANALAKSGWTAAQILAHYYVGTSLTHS